MLDKQVASKPYNHTRRSLCMCTWKWLKWFSFVYFQQLLAIESLCVVPILRCGLVPTLSCMWEKEGLVLWATFSDCTIWPGILFGWPVVNELTAKLNSTNAFLLHHCKNTTQQKQFWSNSTLSWSNIVPSQHCCDCVSCHSLSSWKHTKASIRRYCPHV